MLQLPILLRQVARLTASGKDVLLQKPGGGLLGQPVSVQAFLCTSYVCPQKFISCRVLSCSSYHLGV